VNAQPDPHLVLGVPRDADQAAIHAAYRRAVRRTHPDAGGSADAFDAVQVAYEKLRDSTVRGAPAAPPRRGSEPPPPRAPSPRKSPVAGGTVEDLLADSHRLEDEARRLAGLPPRHRRAPSPAGDHEDSLAAILRDTGQQLRGTVTDGARELRRRARRLL